MSLCLHLAIDETTAVVEERKRRLGGGSEFGAIRSGQTGVFDARVGITGELMLCYNEAVKHWDVGCGMCIDAPLDLVDDVTFSRHVMADTRDRRFALAN